MLRVLAPELGEELPTLELQVLREGSGEEIHLLQLHTALARLIELVGDVDETLEVRVHGTVEREFRVRYRKAANGGIMVATLQRTDIGFRGPPEVRQSAEAHVHVGAAGSWRSSLR
jgi:hypothetical protein